jgi:hypothetical protein
MSLPKAKISPATPRKLAPEMYSPPIAEAFQRGLTIRLAT